MEANIHDHHVRFNLLMDHIDLLPSTERKKYLTETKRKDFFFETFPAKLRREFISGSRVNFYNASVEQR